MSLQGFRTNVCRINKNAILMPLAFVTRRLIGKRQNLRQYILWVHCTKYSQNLVRPLWGEHILYIRAKMTSFFNIS